MVSTVKSQANHYETLGLEPTASDADIARAFAREMSPLRPRHVRDIAQITIAFETLRDPGKRRAYDESLAPKPEPAPSQWSIPRRDGWPFVASARVDSAELPAIDSLPPAPRQPEPQPRAQAPAEPPAPPFVAPPPRTPARADTPEDRIAAPRPQPEPSRRPEAPARPRPAPPSDSGRASHTDMEDRFLDAEDGAIEWKRPALMVGGLFVAVALLGGWLGWESSKDIEQEQPEPALTLTIPKAEAPSTAVSPPASPPKVAEARPEPRERAAPATARIVRAPPPPQPERAEEQVAEAAPSEQSRIEDIASGLAAADSPAVEATPAKLPLPNAVVARTIGRIGYACGQVASTTAVEGAGVFKVTCTSGDSYRAAPVRGRYHFRRWGRQ